MRHNLVSFDASMPGVTVVFCSRMPNMRSGSSDTLTSTAIWLTTAVWFGSLISLVSCS
jgi:hypothetical protein